MLLTGAYLVLLLLLEWRTIPKTLHWPIIIGGVPLVIICNVVLNRWSLQRSRMTAGLCTNCGYDLRASKDRCPECGKAIEKTVTDTAVYPPRPRGARTRRRLLTPRGRGG